LVLPAGASTKPWANSHRSAARLVSGRTRGPRRPRGSGGSKAARGPTGGGTAAASLDDLIRPRQQRPRDREAEGLGGLEVDDQLILRRLLDGNIPKIR